MSELEAKALQLADKIERCILLENFDEARRYQTLLDSLVKLATPQSKKGE